MELESVFKEVKGLDNMSIDKCKYCGTKKDILVEKKKIKLYKFCKCQQSQDAISRHDKAIQDIRISSRRFSYNEFLEKAKYIPKMDKGNSIDPDIWSHNVDCMFFEFIGYEKDIFNDVKMYYKDKHKDKIDFIKTDEYFKRLTGIYFNIWI